jgi:hypothetical protein
MSSGLGDHEALRGWQGKPCRRTDDSRYLGPLPLAARLTLTRKQGRTGWLLNRCYSIVRRPQLPGVVHKEPVHIGEQAAHDYLYVRRLCPPHRVIVNCGVHQDLGVGALGACGLEQG